MADEKWIADLRADMPASAAAQITLSLRLGAVRDRLPDAVFRSEDDHEHVHQLRVSTRRAAAAMRLFADCVPEALHRKTRKALRALRRSAAEARDWDVFLAMLQARLPKATSGQRRGLDFLLGFAHGQRVLAQDHLRLAFSDKAETFAAHVQQTNDALLAARDSRKKLGELAGPMLTNLLRELETAARGNLEQYEALHQVRIL